MQNGITIKTEGKTFIGTSLKSNPKAYSIEEYIYYLSFSLYSLSYLFSYTTFQLDPFIQVLKYISLSLLIIKILLQKYNTFEFINLVVILLLAILSYRTSHNSYILELILFVLGGQEVDFLVLARLSLALLFFTIVVTTVSSACGIIDNLTAFRDGQIRYSYGFTHPNRLGGALFALMVSYTTIRFGKISYAEYILYILAAYFVNYLTDSRTAVLMLLVLGVISIIHSKSHEKNNLRVFLPFLVLIMYVMVLAIILLLIIIYDPSNSILFKINGFLSGRISIAHIYWSLYPPALLGHDETLMVSLYNYNGVVIDIAYAKLLLVHGIILFMIIVLLQLRFFIDCVIYRYIGPLMLGSFIIFCYGLSETYSLQFGLNYFLIAMTIYVYPINNRLKSIFK